MEKGQSLSKIKRIRKRAPKKGALRERKGRIAEKEITDGASASSSFPSIPTGGGSDQYDVFLSFRGSDTRKEFTDHLYLSLKSVGTVPISVFRDNNSLEIGKDFNSEILNAITQSKISIPIISENYASSKWCLHELVCIMDCKKRMSHTVLPIFYKVLPSDVRYLKGNFGEAFRSIKKCFDKKDIQEAQQALKEVSYLNGWESEKFANGHEGELVEEVVENILSKLRRNFQLDVPEHLAGVDDHVNKIRNWADIPAGHARMIGIYGMGGIGKTTLAKVIYNKLSNDFVHCSFIPNIREKVKVHNNLPYLQNLLIKDIQPNERQVCTVDEGISLIKSRFKGRKVLILLDDVDHREQLNALVRKRDWFTTGSIIIVTTRYKAILDQSMFEVDYQYELNELNGVHSLLLFRRHAFRMGQCPKDFEGISRQILSTMGGLPLAIEVIGSYLYGKVDENIWQEMLKKLRSRPDRSVQKILQISYDALEYEHQQIFLDIACFFIGEDNEFAIYMWKDCEFYPRQGIEELKLRCLIKIDDQGIFKMHDQLRDLGRHIFCQGQPPERCLKPWLEDKALRRKMQTEAAKQLKVLDLSYSRELRCTPNLSAFTKLEIFNLSDCYKLKQVDPSIGKLKSLISLDLCRCHNLKELPEEVGELQELKELLISIGITKIPMLVYSLKKLEKLAMESCHSLVEILIAIENLSSLKQLKLGGCMSLTKIPNSIGNLSSLEQLDLRNCKSLIEIPSSIGNLSSLEQLDLRNCLSLTEIPSSIGNLSSLEKLDLRYCMSLTEIPNSIGNLSSLEQLDLGDCWSLIEIPSSIGNLSSLKQLDLQSCVLLREIPSSIGNLSSLEQLYLRSCESLIKIPSSIGNLSFLKKLNLKSCKSLIEIPNSIGNLSSLKQLDLMSCESLTEISSSIGDLSSLKQLQIRGCVSLREIPSSIGNISSLEQLNLWGCKLLTKIPSSIGNLSSLKQLDLRRCELLIEIPSSIGDLSSLKQLQLGGCVSLREIPSSIGNLSSLEQLDLWGCMLLTEIPISIGNLSSLKQLDLKSCELLIEIPNSIGDLSSLEQLQLGGCVSLREIPSSIENLSSLKVLGLEACKSLREIPISIENFSSLKYLNLYGCCSLKEIPTSIGNLPNLQSIGDF